MARLRLKPSARNSGSSASLAFSGSSAPCRKSSAVKPWSTTEALVNVTLGTKTFLGKTDATGRRRAE
jgi:hypothetical protein